MEDLNRTTYFYRKKFKSKESQFNKPAQLPEYFGEMIGDKKEVVIAELGAGPINTIGNYWPGVEVTIYASDVMQPEYEKFWQASGKKPIVVVEYQDFERLTYPDNFFDIVHCVNALDHTEDAWQALQEIQRVCKPGGWIYLRHAQNQMDRYGGMHRWNIHLYEDSGVCLIQNKTQSYSIDQAQPKIEGDLIVSKWQKPI